MPTDGYVNYFNVLGLDDGASPGDVRKTFKREMKKLVQEIARAEINEERRSHFLLEMAKLNAALYLLRDKTVRDAYWNLRSELIELEQQWKACAGNDSDEEERVRRLYEGKLRDFLSMYVEEAMLEAGRDKECVDASHWDQAHERHSFRILRHYRHGLHHDILKRLPYHEITEPNIDWEERARFVADVLAQETL